MNGDVHNLAHKKSLKGLVDYNKDYNTSFLKKMFQSSTQQNIQSGGLLLQMTKVVRDHNTSIEPILKTLCTLHPSYAKWKRAHPHH
jgi:hypothetical protein